MASKWSDIWKDSRLTRHEKEVLVQLERVTAPSASSPKQYKSAPHLQPAKYTRQAIAIA